MPAFPQQETLVVIPSGSISRFESQLVPFLQLRGVFEKGENRIDGWLKQWLTAPSGYFWGAYSQHPAVDGVYLVHPRERKDEGGSFRTTIRIGDCKASFQTATRMPDSFYVKVLDVDGGKATVEPCGTPNAESHYANRFRVFYTADGVTGQLEQFGESDAVQLVFVLPNERMLTEDLIQLPERVSVRSESFPLRPIILSLGADNSSAGSRLSCLCPNCHGMKEVKCEKCGGAGTLTCIRCDGSGHIDCKKCGGTGSFTLPARDATCKKCGGSGNYYRNGDYVGECRLCGGSGTVHFDAHDVECSACDGTGEWECKGCSGTGSVNCFACQGKGEFECWVCRGKGTLRVLQDFKSGRFFRKNKDETIWLQANAVFLEDDETHNPIPITGRWSELLSATDHQRRESDAVHLRADQILRDGKSIDACLEKVLRLSPASVKPFEIQNPTAAPGRKTKGRVRYTFKVCGNPPWLTKHGTLRSEGMADRNKSPGPFSPDTPVSIEGVVVPVGKSIVYESCDDEGRHLTLSFPLDVDVSVLEGKKLSVRADEIPPPERRERERLAFWMEDTNAPILRGLIEGVDEQRSDIDSFLNPCIPRFSTQVEAVRQGLSDAPALLLKGPPGTGKTTVIVELIRQAVQRGKRVLLTSQTHQAVDNVLERLHRFRESGEDRMVRMAVYAASENKLSELGRRYMAGGQEDECREIRNRAEAALSELVTSCNRNRAIRTILFDGRGTASDIRRVFTMRDEALRKAEKGLNDDLESILTRNDAEVAKENTSFASFMEENGKRRLSIKRNIEDITRKITALEVDRDWFDQQAKGRSAKSGFAKNTWVGHILREATDRTLRGIDSIAGTHLDPKNAREAWRETNKALNEAWEKKRKDEEELAIQEEEYRKTEAVHKATCSTLEEVKNSELKGRRESYKTLCASISENAERETTPLYGMQRRRILELVEKEGKDEARGLVPESTPDDWGADIERLDHEFSILEKRRQFVFSWSGELKSSSSLLMRFLNAQTNVFFATCVGMGSWRALFDGTYEIRENTGDETGRTWFDLAIVDEAGHATFAETVVPICSSKKVILIGDDKQLPPMLGEDLDCRRDMDNRCQSHAVGEDDERRCWFEYSMFQYLWEHDEMFRVPRLMLDTQFRMHPDIAEFISETFYEGKLKTGVTGDARHFTFGSFQRPVCLLSTSKQKDRFETWVGNSCKNLLEAKYVHGVIEELLSSLEEGTFEGSLDAPLSLAVITPYREQENLLETTLADCFCKTDRVAFSAGDIASVDRFQGDERDIVIASFVRSPDPKSRNRKLTFVHDLKRMNVAFSRARRMLILVGDIQALESAPGREGGRSAFVRFHEHVDKHGREILVWERKERTA